MNEASSPGDGQQQDDGQVNPAGGEVVGAWFHANTVAAAK